MPFGGYVGVTVGGRLRRNIALASAAVALGLAVVPSGALVPELPPAVLVGAGDIATCGGQGDERTATLLDAIEGTIFTTGDNVYPDGTISEFNACYHPSWGRHRARTKPSPGNHEHHTPGAAGYFEYFRGQVGDDHWYSYDLGAWHVIALDSECDAVGGCGPGSPQHEWLLEDLAANDSRCIAAYWHHPLFSSGRHGSDDATAPFWDALYQHGADIVLNGHDHVYERFAPQDPSGNADDDGIRQFTVGTGGAHLTDFPAIEANSEARRNASHGVLRLQLFSERYVWEYISVEGAEVLEEGGQPCDENEPPPVARFSTVGDASVFEAQPTVNAGSAPMLEVDQSPAARSYVRFDVAGLLQAPERAQLRFWVTNGSPDGPEVRAVTGSWTESSVTWNSQPSVSAAVLDDAGSVSQDGWLTLDVTEAVTGNGSYSFALLPTSTNGVDLRAREYGATPPELVLTLPPAAPCPAEVIPNLGDDVCDLLD